MGQNMVPAAQIYYNQGIMPGGDPSFQPGGPVGQVVCTTICDALQPCFLYHSLQVNTFVFEE